jgi:hypothetical protein
MVFCVKSVSKVCSVVMTTAGRHQRFVIYFKFIWGMCRVLRSALFWDIVQCRMLIPYRHFGTNVTNEMSHNVGMVLQLYTA